VSPWAVSGCEVGADPHPAADLGLVSSESNKGLWLSMGDLGLGGTL
jgi:hypothetical protein